MQVKIFFLKLQVPFYLTFELQETLGYFHYLLVWWHISLIVVVIPRICEQNKSCLVILLFTLCFVTLVKMVKKIKSMQPISIAETFPVQLSSVRYYCSIWLFRNTYCNSWCITLWQEGLKENGYTLRGGYSVKLFCHPSEKVSTLEKKEFSPLGRKFFPFRVDLCSEGSLCAVIQT